jgi:adenosylmethionine-8-amino-7-oxononanoate aminotransferase
MSGTASTLTWSPCPKGVTSGYAPLGGVLVSPRIWQPFYRDCEQRKASD